jgi:hypothetical protein
MNTPEEITPSEELAKIKTLDLLPKQPLMTPIETAAATKTSTGVLAVDRCLGRRLGLKWVRQGRRIYYKTVDVAAYIDSLK